MAQSTQRRRQQSGGAQAREFTYDVVIVGTGTAAMNAAMAVRETGASMGIVEKAPKEERGGNSYLTGGMRLAFNSIEDLIPLINDPTPKDIQAMADVQPHRTPAELYDELMEANHGKSDQELLNIHVNESYNTIRWIRSRGQDFVPSELHNATAGGTVIGTNGGTRALLELTYSILERDRVPFHYQTAARELIVDNGRVVGLKALTPQGDVVFHAKSVILACGGYQANPEMRARYLGRPWDTMKIRGVPYDTGDGQNMAMAIGGMPYGAWNNAHCSLQDVNMAPYSLPSGRRGARGGSALGISSAGSSRYSYPYCMLVNMQGKRFVDEAWEKRGLTYSQMGQHVLRQPEAVAFEIFDAKARRMNLVTYDPATATGAKANTLEGLAEQLGIDPRGLVQTVREFNTAIQSGPLDPSPWRKDGKHTEGLAVNKSNYSISVSEPPFEGYTVIGGMTFTWGGMKVDPATAQVEHVGGWLIPGLYAAGDMMGGLFIYGYGSGSAQMSAATFGRKAGYAAGKAARGE